MTHVELAYRLYVLPVLPLCIKNDAHHQAILSFNFTCRIYTHFWENIIKRVFDYMSCYIAI